MILLKKKADVVQKVKKIKRHNKRKLIKYKNVYKYFFYKLI